MSRVLCQLSYAALRVPLGRLGSPVRPRLLVSRDLLAASSLSGPVFLRRDLMAV
ncbi:MAG TPA: hypothetical protein VMF65_09470 [Acidimicrobiales bacterium]|nr:hypothetical protein [Acidimicrobiales bacterium]